MTLTALKYVSEMRSNLSLLRRSKRVPASVFHAVRADVSSYLAQEVLIYPPS